MSDTKEDPFKGQTRVAIFAIVGCNPEVGKNDEGAIVITAKTPHIWQANAAVPLDTTQQALVASYLEPAFVAIREVVAKSIKEIQE